jgi:hypothetical protein
MTATGIVVVVVVSIISIITTTITTTTTTLLPPPRDSFSCPIELLTPLLSHSLTLSRRESSSPSLRDAELLAPTTAGLVTQAHSRLIDGRGRCL